MTSREVEPGVWSCACGCGGNVEVGDKAVVLPKVNWYLEGHASKGISGFRTGKRAARKARA